MNLLLLALHLAGPAQAGTDRSYVTGNFKLRESSTLALAAGQAVRVTLVNDQPADAAPGQGSCSLGVSFLDAANKAHGARSLVVDPTVKLTTTIQAADVLGGASSGSVRASLEVKGAASCTMSTGIEVYDVASGKIVTAGTFTTKQ